MPIPFFPENKHFPMTDPKVQRRTLAVLLPLALGWSAVCAQTELSDLAKIQASGVLKVGVYKNNAPFSDGPVTDMKGLDIDIAKALAKQLQLKLTLLPFDAGENMGDDLRNMVWRGHYLGYGPADVMMHVPVDKYLAQQNRQVFIFAPYMRQTQVLLHDTAVLPSVSGSEDLKGFKLAAERGTGTASVLMAHNAGMLMSQVALYSTGVEAAKAVIDGKAAGAFVMRSQAESILSQSQSQPAHWSMSPLPLYGVPENGWPLGMAVKTDYKDLAQAMQKAMQELRSSGELLAIFKSNGMTLTSP
ncbi:transporter substrate-binding domain-containing protein [Polaromonas naphthalenivorans]|uniref:Amino acid ABC transporter substrate-binding protein, PAAT family n=1 Tax=Polaromonas naphthalenivorans (strain CJ2) TaxID=365044 RepID=A1VK78_POLNA|nr:transporter substrate-binding domain-containing protein [Polaromonas naphthalenivorans]ABM36056.1 amino acid ABC transporter substrate-binding protein, PAAT family [Polaromonas naphthalenivorans CJ2]